MMRRDNFIIALGAAIEARSLEEKAIGYSFDSALVAGWREVYAQAIAGHHIDIEDNPRSTA